MALEVVKGKTISSSIIVVGTLPVGSTACSNYLLFCNVTERSVVNVTGLCVFGFVRRVCKVF